MERMRRTLRRQFTTLESDFLKLVKSKTVDLEELTVIFRNFCDVNSSLLEIDNKIRESLLANEEAADDEADRELDKELNEVAEFKKRAEVIRVKFEKLTVPTPVAETESSSGSFLVANENKRKFKLPPVKIKKFSGDLLEWLGFWAQFKKVDDDEDLHESDKFWHLIEALEPGSEPHTVVSVYPQDAENYCKAVDALKRRYGDEDLLLQVYIRELLKLVIRNLNSKEKDNLDDLFLKLDGNFRALKTLNLEKADPATWLFPLVESSLPEDVQDNWQRSPMSSMDGRNEEPPKNRLDYLMSFMEKEVQIKKRIELTKSFTASTSNSSKEEGSKRKYNSDPVRVPTLAGFHISDKVTCIFCNKGNHHSCDCFKAQRMPRPIKIDILKKRKACFRCFENHLARDCTTNVKCHECGEAHFTIICEKYKGDTEKSGAPPSKIRRTDVAAPSTSTVNYSNQTGSRRVTLQTVLLGIKSSSGTKIVRAFLDPGSERSYILRTTASQLQLKPVSEERVSHMLFGGVTTKETVHKKYQVVLERLDQKYQCQAEVRDQVRICGDIPRPSKHDDDLVLALEKNNVTLTDIGEGCPPIEILLGADLYGQIILGNVIQVLSGIVAVETRLGWVIGEKQDMTRNCSLSTVTLDMAISDAAIATLWDLDSLGIRDPIEVATRESECLEEKEKEVALKRLESTTRKLIGGKLYQAYDKLFCDWEAEGFIERCDPLTSEQRGHYLPHRAVVKLESLTTPVRPVFDASCRNERTPSLNDCLQKGANLIQLIPEVLLRFREKKIAFVADIRKAFQMIEVCEKDRDFLRFFWWKNSDMTEELEYRHVRVPFGATCSPFILGAVLEFHLSNLPEEEVDIGKELLLSLYVDNCLLSKDTEEEYRQFRKKSVSILKRALMDLRMWLSNFEDIEDQATRRISVLGLLCDRKMDTLTVEISKISIPEEITKRVLLSVVQQIFDPIGFTSPALISMKKVLQQTWINKLKWSQPLPEEQLHSFKQWYKQLPSFRDINVPRMMTGGERNRSDWSLHVFCDASQVAYAAAVFLRVGMTSKVTVRLLAAKSRVSPLRPTTIPRLELLGCVIGARLSKTVTDALKMEKVRIIYWSDLSTALAWIRRNEQWGTFVGNRTKEICKLTCTDQWRHIPGSLNPADLPSRGCSPEELARSRWWEGPAWLYLPEADWPSSDVLLNEDEINKEKKKTTIVSFFVLANVKYNYPYQTLVRISGWINRFIQNCMIKDKLERMKGKLSDEELFMGEIKLIRNVQEECFGEGRLNELKGFELLKDEYGVLRVKTKLTYRKDQYSFKYPALMPSKHPVTLQLIRDTHTEKSHAGTGYIMVHLREKFWILRSRQTINSVISKCYRCRKLSAKPTITEAIGLPEDRVKNAEPYEIVGIDLAGPLYLKNGKKQWLVIFTCALYRAVYFELVNSVGTRTFVKALEKFVQRFRRPAVIYCDNGTNFRGAENLFKRINWAEIQQDVSQIIWKFSPPTGAWWGGWWERLIRSAKDLMRRTIGKGSLNHQELYRVVGNIAEVMNGRPLTYVSENIHDLEPLTPAMFINPLGSTRFPESELDGRQLRLRYKYMETLQKELQQRWRKEYLSMLISRPKKATRKLNVGELVVVSDDKKRRHDWALARIIEMVPGKDGIARVAKIKTTDGEYIRPIQRLHALEADEAAKDREMQMEVKTRYGRKVKLPVRFK